MPPRTTGLGPNSPAKNPGAFLNYPDVTGSALSELGGIANGQAALEVLSALLKFIFSWVLLTPLSVIIAGKLLARRLRLPPLSKQLFRISLGQVLKVQATNAEVILGFTGFILTLTILGLTSGARAYHYFKLQFGVDPGHFTSLCVLSSFLLVGWSTLLFSTTLLTYLRDPADRRLRRRQKELLEKISKKEEG